MAALKKFDPQLREAIRARLQWTVEEKCRSTPELIEARAKRDGYAISARYIRNVLAGKSSLTIDKVTIILTACDWTLGEFFEAWMPPTKDGNERRVHAAIQLALRKHDTDRKHVLNLYNILNPQNPIQE